MSKKSKGGWQDPELDAPLSSPFAAAFGGLDASPMAAPVKPTEVADSIPKRAVLRFSKKGRGGKAVTEISHLGLTDEQLSQWCTRLRKSLGCGGSVEGDLIVLQGDQRERAAAWLQSEGVAKISH
ncbi:MAG: translation initiation factor [Myxococcales bacterium]|nr:translation initiation factor [Myxococcales bacterium]